MSKLIRKRLTNQKGFTLVELMVVVVIIGILVGIAVPAYNKVTANAEKNACDANIRTLQGAVQMYKAQEGDFPTDVDALVSEFLAENVTCPSDNETEYDIDNDGNVTCSNHDNADAGAGGGGGGGDDE